MSDLDAAPSMAEIAREAGVSVSTVSRVLSGRGDLRRETRARVFNAAAILGYHPALTGRGRPATSDPRLFELVLGSFDDAWTNEVTTGARDAAFELGLDLVLTLERDDPADDWPARIARRRPSGVVLGLIRPTMTQLAELKGLRIPLVLFDPMSDPRGELASVGTTDRQGGYDAGTHLAASGLNRFVVVAGSPPFRFGRAREEGFRAAIADHAPRAVIHRVEATWTDANVVSAFAQLWEHNREPAGVFGCNDEMALAVYRAAKRLRLSIPGDLSVVGFNDEPRAAAASPPLTSVRQPVRKMASTAVKLAQKIHNSGTDQFERIELRTKLVVRESTRADEM